MKGSWWRSREEMDEDQTNFITLPAKGRYALIGPPGSGKTNLLLLRALYTAGTGEKNVLILTYTKSLADFIRTGIGKSGLITIDQVKTFHAWVYSHILEHLGERPLPPGSDFDDNARQLLLEMLLEANNRLPGKKIYSAIFVDEAQDLTFDELNALLCLSENVCISGDENQGIYRRDGLSAIDKLGLTPHYLRQHFRIGQKIARVADRLCPNDNKNNGLEATSNYNPKSQGESSAKLIVCINVEDQFKRMCEIIEIQLDAFKDDNIGVFCGKKESLIELREMFLNTKFSDLVAVHGLEDGAGFYSEKRIHIMTIHSSKGTEFRAVHIFKAEDLNHYPLNRTRVSYTAVTRARTALNVYRSAETNRNLESAMSEPKVFNIDDLFSGDL
ncbi:TPA: ATP-dependent helicase [Klebsiella aerogenes]|uniref:ATP-binding domain-containing protein n=1 Tax=Klebsiella aerogenes TaxID=548 RepID=UPI00063BFBB9|nr:ATP-dependent helicase [Klebsiella aerogenes]KLF40015.1 superfamily I DNA/RNA helicase [Klebsiella aerogenes]HDT4029266.1 ATP-dependent helicase [Klebsiella aerogenes]HDT5450611.1 ATP-dependent helicase [Klebsiella aerogenes]